MPTADDKELIWTKKYPELGSAPVPIEPCCSPAYFELERERVFRRTWLNVGRVEELPNPGDYYVRELAVCRTSVLVMRGRDRKISAFHNMCSHRGNKLVWESKGNCRALTCKFHGWTYDTSGRLIGVPDEKNFFNLKKDGNGLTAVKCEIWQGFIFVNLDPDASESLLEYLGEVAEQLKGYPFDKLTSWYTYHADERVNWKILLDAQQEGYHVPILHRRTFVKAFESESIPYYRSVDVRLFRRHRMLAAGGTGDRQGVSPVETLARRYGATTFGAMSGGDYAGKVDSPLTGTFDFWVIFPNFVIAIMEGTYFTYNIWPLAVDHTLWEVRSYYPPPRNAGERFSQEYAKCTLRDPLLEDGSVHEAIQSTLASGAKTHFNFQDEEITLRHGHKVVADYVRDGK